MGKKINKWIDSNFNIRISKKIWLNLINNWMAKYNKKGILNNEIAKKIWGTNCSFKKMDLNTVKKLKNTYAGKWFNSNQNWVELYFKNEYLYVLYFDYFSTSRHTYPVVGVYEKGNIVVDVGGSIFGAYNLLKYGAKKVLITNYDNSFQNKFNNFIIKKFKLNIKIILNNKIPHNSILLCSEYFEHFKNVDIELNRLLQFKPKRIYVKNSFCFPAYGHYIPIKIKKIEYYDSKSAQKIFQNLLISRGYNLTKIDRFFGKIERYDKLLNN